MVISKSTYRASVHIDPLVIMLLVWFKKRKEAIGIWLHKGLKCADGIRSFKFLPKIEFIGPFLNLIGG